jgi:hypothetical protein
MRKLGLCQEPHIAARVGVVDRRADLKGLPLLRMYCPAEELIRNLQCKFAEAVMDGSRSDRARARAQQLLAEIAPLPDDSQLQRLRELSLNYIREAERVEANSASTREESEQISAALDAIARDFFARALQSKSRG